MTIAQRLEHVRRELEGGLAYLPYTMRALLVPRVEALLNLQTAIVAELEELKRNQGKNSAS